MTTFRDVVLEHFPDADDDFIEYIIWERTGFPAFWNIPADGNTPEECFRKQVADAAKEINK